MLPDDPRHGSYAGHVAHSEHKIPMCQPCRVAGTRYMKRRRMRVQNGEELMVPRLGAKRRIQALMALGWTGTDIAHACGWADRASVSQVISPPDRGQLGDRGIFRKTHDAICKAYDDMSMQLPEITSARSRVRNTARTLGWPVPLAWDDGSIDDPDARPNLGTIKLNRAGRPMTSLALVEDAEFLADDDHNLTNALERLGVTRENLHQACRRAGRPDVYAKLARREPGTGEMSVAVREAQSKRGAA
jgi:hypothetical protein